MKLKNHILSLLIIVFTMNSCASDSVDSVSNKELSVSSAVVTDYTYDQSELETMKLINEYRVSIGLNELKAINHISFKSDEHNAYMITNKVVNHDDFVARSENIIKVLGAIKVSENVAYNYNTPEAVLKAWLASEGHKRNIEGDFTNFGLAIKIDPVNGRKYYTNIFAKI
ncbi:CAP domain-containing protein [Flavobacterium branchiarum]|uniref:CAP domain-containing protein n=1 Tax=Flavobacterium branchiarum TaxID=1114870 RepID=A0ABV5FKW4_9FLAO|nr:CAP domain-containing protein [Flavobacterium branchiarum]MDN3672725.1 CAP domain-containing protein [Flavobacterium branchiarum]